MTAIRALGMDAGGEVISPDDAFWLLGEETRLAILRAVWDSDSEVVTFTGIRDDVGTPDSGQFNYHLNKLKGPFLSNSDEGYKLTQAGREVVRAVMAGTLTAKPEVPPEQIDGTCVRCGGVLVARYDKYGIVECGDCGKAVMWNEFPPAGLSERSPDEFARAFERWTQSRFSLAMDGVCPNCAAEMKMEISSSPGNGIGEIASNHECPNCKYAARVPLFGHVMDHPEVVSLFYNEGIDVSEIPYWQWRLIAEEFTEEIVSTDPWRARVAIDSEHWSIELTLDESMDVIDISSR